ncbi:MAG: hypothetical protein KBA60_12730 [Flavobacteriales bacterium]|nr:hypothetical protein [Flavobacteriales bacterium]MBP7156871.1 hypothetical protein [Flavobacteriales bacterium]HQV76500.1 hypothetical protein [Flavobacteriales bacterium]HQW40034.1 hypothetical protein [Flavobacteriales bacterium]
MRWMVLAILLALCTGLRAQNTIVGADLDTTRIRIGEQVQLRLQISYAPGSVSKIQWPTVGDTLNAHLEVVSDTGVDTVKNAASGLDQQVRTLTITSFDTGFWAVPPFRFLVNDQPLETAAQLLEVRSMELDSAMVVRDIKDIHTLPFSVGYWLKEHSKWVAIGLGALALIAAVFYFVKKRVRNKVPKAIEAPERPLVERILSALDKLEKERVWQQGDHKGYQSRVTDLLRGYIEERYQVPAMESTTEELMNELRVSPLNTDQRGQLENMLRAADMVKFAKALPSPQENEQMMVGATRFVRDTAPSATTGHA